MKLMQIRFLNLLVIMAFIGLPITALAKMPNSNVIGRVWKDYVSYCKEHPCQLYILGFFKEHPKYERIYAGEIATKLFHETAAVLSSQKTGTKNTAIVLMLKYDKQYFVFLDLSLDTLHMSLGWKEIGASMYTGRQKMLAFDEHLKLVAQVSDQ